MKKFLFVIFCSLVSLLLINNAMAWTVDPTCSTLCRNDAQLVKDCKREVGEAEHRIVNDNEKNGLIDGEQHGAMRCYCRCGGFGQPYRQIPGPGAR